MVKFACVSAVAEQVVGRLRVWWVGDCVQQVFQLIVLCVPVFGGEGVGVGEADWAA